MKELSKVKPEKVTLAIHGKEREIRFSFSAWGVLEEELGGLDLDKLQKMVEEKPFNTIPHLLYIALVDKSAYTDEEGNVYPEVTEQNILEEYGFADIQMITKVFYRALYGSLPDVDEAKKAVEAKKTK